MSEPESWADPELEALLDCEREAVPPQGSAERVLTRVLTTVAAPAAAVVASEVVSGAAHAAGATGAATAAATVGGVSKVLLLVGVVAVGGTTAYVSTREAPPVEDPRPAPVAAAPALPAVVAPAPAVDAGVAIAPQPDAAAPKPEVVERVRPKRRAARVRPRPLRRRPPPVAEPEVEPELAPTEVVRVEDEPEAEPPKPRPEPKPPARAARLAAERALLQRARAAIAGGAHRRALVALRDHARRHPRGALMEEREVLTIQALALTGRGSEARRRADWFRRAFPRSTLLPAVDAALRR